jgi:tRNA(fMet)-specific endonuclease VapC
VTDPAFLIDSNIFIYVLADADSAAARRLEACDSGTVATSVIAYAEVLRGIRTGGADAVARLDALLEQIPILAFDGEAARAYSRLPFRRGSFDRLIAAHALSRGLTLVTNNERDFVDVAGLKVENWTQS